MRNEFTPCVVQRTGLRRQGLLLLQTQSAKPNFEWNQNSLWKRSKNRYFPEPCFSTTFFSDCCRFLFFRFQACFFFDFIFTNFSSRISLSLIFSTTLSMGQNSAIYSLNIQTSKFGLETSFKRNVGEIQI